MMKQKLIEYAIAAVVIGAFDYLLFAFVNWGLNPGNWEFGARVAYVMLFCISMAIYTSNKELLR